MTQPLVRNPLWWQGRQGRTRLLIAAFGVLALAGILVGGFGKLFGGDRREIVVTMQQGISNADRTTLKESCGALAGIRVVADQGAAEAQYRFPVRFLVGDSTTGQESALYDCLNRYPQLVRGVQTENGGM